MEPRFTPIKFEEYSEHDGRLLAALDKKGFLFIGRLEKDIIDGAYYCPNGNGSIELNKVNYSCSWISALELPLVEKNNTLFLGQRPVQELYAVDSIELGPKKLHESELVKKIYKSVPIVRTFVDNLTNKTFAAYQSP